MVERVGHGDGARGLALKRCDELIDWYERNKRRHRLFDNMLQTSIISAAGLTAFAAAADAWPKWAIVLPAVVTTVAAGLSTNFRFREKYVNFAFAGERLKWLKLSYQIRSEHSTDMKDIEGFVNQMEAVVSAEMGGWRESLLSGDTTAGSQAGGDAHAESLSKPRL
jgi:hypothetical protein